MNRWMTRHPDGKTADMQKGRWVERKVDGLTSRWMGRRTDMDGRIDRHI